MKFLCDRCKTRYSIGDDRVRGKILKIRCKNCANVITVREGMSAEADGAPGDAADRARKASTAATEVLEPAPAAAGASRAANEPAAPSAAGASRAANEPAANRGAARDPLAGLTGKRATDVDTVRGLGRGNARGAASPPRGEGQAAHAAPAPAALEEEWYVSIDGEQAGPFSLAAAQRWVTQQPADAELHCWSEGFDDWLPVDKVSHFRGLRKRPLAPTAPPPLPRAAGAPRPDPAEDEPKPLFAATMASLERGASAMPVGLGLPPPAGSPPPASPASPIATRGDLASRPTNGAQGPATTPLGRRPEAEAAGKRDVRSQAQRAPAAEARPARKPGAGDAERAAVAPAGPERRRADPFDLGDGDDNGSDGKTVLEAMPFEDGPAEPRRTAAAPGAAAAAPEGTAPAAPAHAAPRSDFGSDDDLDIGEVSRVVNLADIARGAAAQDRTAARRAATAPVVPRATGIEPSPRATGRSTAPAPSQPPDDAELRAASAPIMRAQRRGLIALLAVAMLLVLAVIGAVVLVTREDDAPTTGLGRVHDIDTSRPDDPVAHHPVGSAGSASAAVPPSTPVAPRSHPRTVPSPGGGQIAEAPPAGNALAGDEIEDVARKHQDMTQRCYMRSQRGADAILIGDVKKIAVTLTIDRDGNVSDLQLSDHSADNLGKCLAGAIRTWKFRASAGGTFRFSLNFVDG